MDYGLVLHRTWGITWRYRALWFFGFLASLFIRVPDSIDKVLPRWDEQRVLDLFLGPSIFSIVGGAVLFFTLLGVFVTFIKSLGQAGLIHQVDSLSADGPSPSIRRGWGASRRFGWRLFGINFLLGLPVYALFMLGLMPFLLPVTLVMATGDVDSFSDLGGLLVGGLGVLPPVCCLGVLVGAFLAWLGAITQRVCVIEDQPVWQSIERGWGYLRRHFGALLSLGLLLSLISTGFVVLIIVPIFILMIPFLIPFIAAAEMLDGAYPYLPLLGYLCTTLLFWIMVMALGSIQETFISTAWTLAFRELSEPEQKTNDEI